MCVLPARSLATGEAGVGSTGSWLHPQGSACGCIKSQSPVEDAWCGHETPALELPGQLGWAEPRGREGWCEEEEGDEGARGWRGKQGLSCISAPPELESMSKAARVECAPGTGPAQPWGFFQLCPMDGPLTGSVDAWLPPAPTIAGSAPLGFPSPRWTFLSAGPRSPRGVGCLGSLPGVPGDSPSDPHAHMGSAGDSVVFLLLTLPIVRPLCHRGTMQQDSPCPGRNLTHVPGHLHMWVMALERTRCGCSGVCPTRAKPVCLSLCPSKTLGPRRRSG